jgi:hypothetical protein
MMDSEHVTDENFYCVRCDQIIPEVEWSEPCPAFTRDRVEARR